MSRESIAHFQIERLEILTPQGEADEELLPALSDRQFLQLYELFQLPWVGQYLEDPGLLFIESV